MQYSINPILGFIEVEGFVISEIQRPFVWKKKLGRGFCGSVIQWIAY